MSLSHRISPVFLYEAITTARRWQGYALRAVLVVAMLITFYVAWLNTRWDDSDVTRSLAQLGESFYLGVAGIQLSIALLAAPAATAGAVCVDRARGWLQHMFVTHLTDREIILGKFSARFSTMLAFVMAGMPVLAIASLLGGIIPEAIWILTIVTLAVCFLGCSFALLLSVRLTRPHEVLMIVFAFWALWLLSLPFWIGLSSAGVLPTAPDWFARLNPFVLVYAPYTRPGSLGPFDVAVFVALSMACSLFCLIVAIRLLRKETRPDDSRPEWRERVRGFIHDRLFSWWPNPSLDGNPVLWREWHRNRPSRATRWVNALFTIITIVAVFAGIADIMAHGVEQGRMLTGVQMLAVSFGLLMLSATAPTVLTEERMRGSLDILMTTPLPTRQIVIGKWLATYRRILPLLILPLLTGILVAGGVSDTPGFSFMIARVQIQEVPITFWDRVMTAILPSLFLLAHAAVVTSLGLALATWLKKTGLAIAVSVSSFFVLSFAWVILVELGIRGYFMRWSGGYNTDSYYFYYAIEKSLIALSPLAGGNTAIKVLLYQWNVRRGPILYPLFGTVAVLVLLAAALLGLTILTFNRCMGRMDESGQRADLLAPSETLDHQALASSSVRTTDSAHAATPVT